MKTPEQIIEDQKKEIALLKAKLEDRNPAFNGNLLNKANSEFYELSEKIGKSIYQVLGQEYSHCFKNCKMHFQYDTGLYSGRGWIVYFSTEEEKTIKDGIANVQMKKFQESLDNFAWAVQNGGNNGDLK